MNELRKTTLRNEVDFLVGFPFKSEGYSSEGVRLLRGDNIAQGTLSWSDAKKWPIYEHGNFEPYELQEGDIVLAMDRPWIDAGLKYASVSRYDLPCLLVQRTARLRGGKNLDTKFLKYVIGSPQFTKYIKFITTGSLVPHISGNQIKDFSVYLPHLSIQKKIAAVLSALDAKIDCNNRINAELEAMAKTLYDFWFVQFDFPFDFAQGKPDQNGKPYKSSGGKMTYNPTLKREIPAGWETEKLSQLTTLIRRGISPKYVEKGGTQVLNQKCIREQKISFEDARRQGLTLEDSDDRLLQQFDVLINSTGVGTLGRVAFVKRLNEKKTTVDSHVSIVRADTNHISAEYMAWTMLRFQSVIEAAANGSTGQIELSKAIIEDLDIIIPDTWLLERFSEFLSPIIRDVALREQENEELINLRDWLLPMLMNGQVTVK